MQLGKDECGNLNTFSYDESACREGINDYIIRAEQPFNMMEIDDYSETIQTLINPQFKGWSGNTVKKYIMKKFQTERENLKQYFVNFEGKIYLTSDINYVVVLPKNHQVNNIINRYKIYKFNNIIIRIYIII